MSHEAINAFRGYTAEKNKLLVCFVHFYLTMTLLTRYTLYYILYIF